MCSSKTLRGYYITNIIYYIYYYYYLSHINKLKPPVSHITTKTERERTSSLLYVEFQALSRLFHQQQQQQQQTQNKSRHTRTPSIIIIIIIYILQQATTTTPVSIYLSSFCAYVRHTHFKYDVCVCMSNPQKFAKKDVYMPRFLRLSYESLLHVVIID